MRLILTLVTILLFSFKAIATVERPRVTKIDAITYEKPVLSVKFFKPSSFVEDPTVILYKMKENIIRRELSFMPKKKWMKWV